MNYEAKIMELLEKFQYTQATKKGVSAICKNWLEVKTPLMERFRKHPYWDEEQKAIVFKQEYSRQFDREKTYPFRNWLRYTVIDEYSSERNVTKIKGRSVRDWDFLVSRIYQTLGRLDSLIPYYPELRDSDMRIFLSAEMLEADAVMVDVNQNTICTSDGYRLRNEDYVHVKKIRNLADVIEYYVTEQYLSEDSVKQFQEYFPEAKIVAGQSVSKAVGKICRMLGIDKHPEYNRKFAEFADAVNPLKYTTYTVLSLNILDFLTMSIGHNWSSCHTIDKYKTLYATGGSGYGGCYSAGTLSYAGDDCTFIFYTVDKDFERPDELWSAEKVKRCNFHVRDDGKVLIQGRVYPDGRDGGDNSLATQFRAVVQSVIAECFDLPNFWSSKKPSEDWCYSADGHANYDDYCNYSDCNATLNKELDENDKNNLIIGSEPICIHCGHTYDGDYNDAHEWIYCPDCNPEYVGYCAQCDERILASNDDYVRDRATDDVYCCPNCAERADLHWLADVEEWTSGDAYYDNYDCNYYSDYEVEINGYYYNSEDHAERDGWVYANDTDRWIRRTDAWKHSDGFWYEDEEEEEVG